MGSDEIPECEARRHEWESYPRKIILSEECRCCTRKLSECRMIYHRIIELYITDELTVGYP